MSKEIIALLEKIKGVLYGTSPLPMKALTLADLEKEIDQALVALKAEPKVNLWLIKDYLKKALINRWGLDDAKYWVRQALKELEQTKCKTCGGSGTVDTVPVITGLDTLSERDVPCPDCQQPKAGEFTKELREGLNILSKIYKMPSLRDSNYQLLVNVINKSFEACGKLDSLQAELTKDGQRVSELTSECLEVETDLSNSYSRINGLLTELAEAKDEIKDAEKECQRLLSLVDILCEEGEAQRQKLKNHGIEYKD